MSTTNWLVMAGGLGAIIWINWYFFFAERPTAAAKAIGSAQEVEIEVRGGYDPGVVRLKRGMATRLVFNRKETSSCSEEVVIPALGIRKFLPAFQKTAVEFTPTEAGAFGITCGMSMLHGTIVVEG